MPKCICGRGFALPRPLAGFGKGKGRKGNGREGEEGEGRELKGQKEREMDGRGWGS